jgi:eukaryotic-like serine/threonine-protein kinase
VGGQCGVCGAVLVEGTAACSRCGTVTAPPGAWPDHAVPGYLVEPPAVPAPPAAPSRGIGPLAIVTAILSAVVVLAALVIITDDDDGQLGSLASPRSTVAPSTTAVPGTTTTLTSPSTEPARELLEVWSYDAGAVTADGTAYDGDRVYGATLAGRVFALESSTGDELWSVDIGREVRAAPTVSGGLVVVIGHDADLRGSLLALDAASGTLVWQLDIGVAIATDRPAAVAGPRLFVTATDVIAIDLRTGQELWRAFADPTAPAVATSPMTDGDRVFVELDLVPVNYAALDPASGRLLWQVQASDVVTDVATASDGLFLYQQHLQGAASAAHLVALDSSSGLPRWRASLAAPTIAPPSTVPGGLVLVTEQLAISLSAETGQQSWAVDTGLAYPGVTATDQRVFMNAGSLDALDADTGALVARALPEQLSVLPPSVAGALVLYLDTDGVVHAYQ